MSDQEQEIGLDELNDFIQDQIDQKTYRFLGLMEMAVVVVLHVHDCYPDLSLDKILGEVKANVERIENERAKQKNKGTPDLSL